MKIRLLEVQKQFSGLELELEETLVARQKWRNKYFSKETGLRSTHGCRYCKRRSEFEWTVLFADFPEPGPRDTLPHASKIALPFGKLPFLAFTEECDGSAWLLQKHDIEWLTAQEAVLLDLYITPYHKLNWTLILRMKNGSVRTSFTQSKCNSSLWMLQHCFIALVLNSFRRSGAYVTDPVLSEGTASYTPGVSRRTGTETRYFHTGLKNTDSLTNPGQTVAASRVYDAFRNVVSSSGTWSGPFGYAGNSGYQQDASNMASWGLVPRFSNKSAFVY